ncbi:MAG: citrate transporter [Myxococcales bacterium]|nr:citrate transporter [Myxococcales bacterium]
MLSFIGLALVATCVALLLSGRASPFVTFSTLPVIFALIAGFSTAEIQSFFLSGLHKVTPIAVMFIFAILFFSLMQEKGLFEPMITAVVKRAANRVVAIPIATVSIATIAHLDGSGASTFLICIPTLLPVYERLKLSPYLLLLLVSASASVMNMLPWGGPLGRAASVIQTDPTSLWYHLIPVQISALCLLLVGAFLLGHREKKRRTHDDQFETVSGSIDDLATADSTLDQGVYRSLGLNWWFNLCLTLGVIGLLFSGIFSAALVFIMALSLALSCNRMSIKEQHQFIKRHAWSALQMAMIIFAAGIFLGVLTESKMLHALAQSMMQFLPETLLTYIHIIIGILGVPFELILNTDAYYFALLPIVQQATSPYGVSSESVVYAMLIGNIIGTFISPFSPALWLALGLAKLDMGEYLRYAFAWIWALSLLLMLVAWGIGLF